MYVASNSLQQNPLHAMNTVHALQQGTLGRLRRALRALRARVCRPGVEEQIPLRCSDHLEYHARRAGSSDQNNLEYTKT